MLLSMNLVAPASASPEASALVHTTVVGSYPRVGDTHEEQKLRRAIAQFDKGEIADTDLRAVEREVVRDVLREQAEAGVELVTDGQVTWYDSQSHVARRFEGVEIGGLIRYFDTNTYYRQPIVRGPIAWKAPVLADEWRYAQAHVSVGVKAVVPGPVTIASLALNKHYATKRALALALAEALASEVRTLAEAGARHIQVDEPILTRRPEDLRLVEETWTHLAEAKGRAELTLFVAFGDIAEVYRRVVRLPADRIGLDLVQGAKTWAQIEADGADKPLVLGLVDARNTRPEDPADVAARLQGLRRELDLEECWLSPSNGLEFLPRAKAREKLAIVVEAARLAGVA